MTTTTLHYRHITLFVHESVAIQFGVNTTKKIESLEMMDRITEANIEYSRQLNEAYAKENQRNKYVTNQSNDQTN